MVYTTVIRSWCPSTMLIVFFGHLSRPRVPSVGFPRFCFSLSSVHFPSSSILYPCTLLKINIALLLSPTPFSMNFNSSWRIYPVKIYGCKVSSSEVDTKNPPVGWNATSCNWCLPYSILRVSGFSLVCSSNRILYKRCIPKASSSSADRIYSRRVSIVMLQ